MGDVVIGVVGVSVMFVGPAVVSVLKGKWDMAVLGIIILPFLWFGAIRLALPHSYWARRLYDSRKTLLATLRYPEYARRVNRADDEEPGTAS